MKTHLDLARAIYTQNNIHYAWDQLPLEQKAEYIYIAEQAVDLMQQVLGPENTYIKIVTIQSKDLKGGCCGG